MPSLSTSQYRDRLIKLGRCKRRGLPQYGRAAQGLAGLHAPCTHVEMLRQFTCLQHQTSKVHHDATSSKQKFQAGLAKKSPLGTRLATAVQVTWRRAMDLR